MGLFKKEISVPNEQAVLERIERLKAEAAAPTAAANLESILSKYDVQAQQLGLDQTPEYQALRQSYITAPDGLKEQNFIEFLAQAQIRKRTQQRLGEFRTKAETQFLGAPGATLEQALASPTGELGQLSEALKKQQSGVFREELSPMIQMQLGARGLQDSGANVELQSKALGGLERSRQGALTGAFFGGKQQLRGLERTDILGDIGSQQQALAQAFGLQRAGITMQFQRELEAQRARVARELAELSGGRDIFKDIYGGIQAGTSIAALLF